MEHRERLVASSVVILTVALCSCNQSIRHQDTPELKLFNESTLQLQSENGVFTRGGIAFSGIVYSLAPNNIDTIAVGTILNGSEHGEWRKYFANGQLMEKRFYEHGKKTGLYEAWWPNGLKRLTYHFQNGEYEGRCSDWSEKGILVNDMNYHEGHECGEQKQFYEDGNVRSNYVIKDGRRYGLLGTKNCVNVSDSIFK